MAARSSSRPTSRSAGRSKPGCPTPRRSRSTTSSGSPPTCCATTPPTRCSTARPGATASAGATRCCATASPSARSVSKGRAIDRHSVMLTLGGVQAITLACRAFLDPGDVLAVEAPTWGAALSAATQAGAEALAIPMDADGMQVDVLEQELERLAGRGQAAQDALHDRDLQHADRMEPVAAAPPEAARARQPLRVHRARGQRVRRAAVRRRDDPHAVLARRVGARRQDRQLQQDPRARAAAGLGQRRSRGDARDRRGQGRPRREPVAGACRHPLHGRGQARSARRDGQRALPGEARHRGPGAARPVRAVGDASTFPKAASSSGSSCRPTSTANR